MNIKTLLANVTNRWSRNGQSIEYIVMHYVGAVSSAKNNAEYLHRDKNLGWSAHFFTDEIDTYQSVPLDESAGHCGVDYSGGKAPLWGKCRNKNSIGIEMCCKKDSAGNWFIEPATVDRTVDLVRWLMKQFNIPVSRVVRHYDVCWKRCPEPWVRDPLQWEDFKKRIAEPEPEEGENMKEVIYHNISEMPDWYADPLREQIDRGVSIGRTPTDLDLSESMVRVLVICIRIIKNYLGIK